MRDARITLLSRNPDHFIHHYSSLVDALDVTLFKGDVQHAESLPADKEFTHILHAATDSTTGLSLTPLARYDQIVDGTRNILNLAVKGACPRVLIVSSGGVYGPQPTWLEAIPEDYLGFPDPMNPDNAYSVAKRAAEHLGAIYSDAFGLDVPVARCFSFVGPDLPLDAHFAIGNFIADVRAGRDIVIKGDGTPLRSYLDQRDLARWLTRLLFSGQSRRAYNVGSDQAISIADLAALVARLGGGRSGVRVLGKAPTGQASQRSCYVPDITRARTELGLDVKYPLEEAVLHALREVSGRAGA